MNRLNSTIRRFLVTVFCVLSLSFSTLAQGTEFTYQGKLTASGTAANGNHDFEFLLFDSLAGGTQLGSTITLNTVSVADGSFAVKLDFGAHFPGANRFLELRVRPSGGGAFTPLTPSEKLHIAVNSGRILIGDAGCGANFGGIGFAATLASCNNYSVLGDGTHTFLNRPTGGGLFFRENNADQLVIKAGGSVGIGTAAPENKLQVNGAVLATGPRITPSGAGATLSSENTYDALQSWASRPLVLNGAGNDVGIGTTAPADKLHVNGIIRIEQLGTAGGSSLCRNADKQLAACGSSIRYKSNVRSLPSGLDVLKRLRPISFNWKNGGTRDMGLVAEEVAEVEPLLVTHNKNGEIEGVKYDRVGVVLVNAVKEQQQQIEAQKKEIDILKHAVENQQATIELLRQAVCKQGGEAAVCRVKP